MNYDRGLLASGLACIAAALMFSSVASAKGEDHPLANVMRAPSSATAAAGEASGMNTSKLMALLRGSDAVAETRGGSLCFGGAPNSSPDEGEECDDGDDSVAGDGCTGCMLDVLSDCTRAIAGTDSANQVSNGDFELGATDWVEASDAGFGPISSPGNCGGCNFSNPGDPDENWVWMGGLPDASDASVTQMVTIPTDATTLEFDIFEGFCVPQDGTGDFVSVTLGGTEVFNSGACNDEVPGTYVTEVVDLATAPGGPYNDGGTYELVVFGSMDFTEGDPQTGSIFVDNVRINTPLAEPILPVPSECYVGMCGDGILSSGEICDDGDDTVPGDGCTACALDELTHVCFNDGVDTGLAVAGGALDIGDDIADGGLEQGSPNPDWDEAGTIFDPICSAATCGADIAADGLFYAWFGGSRAANVQSITQETVITTAGMTLEFDLLVGVCDSASDVLRVFIDGDMVFERLCTSDTPIYQRQVIDLTAGGYNDGNSHTIVIAGETFSVNGSNSNHFVDNIGITYPLAVPRDPISTSCDLLAEACDIAGLPEQFNSGLGAMQAITPIFSGVLTNAWTTTDDPWTEVGDETGCGGPVSNWSGGNLTGGSGAAACSDSDGAAESLKDPDPITGAPCIVASGPNQGNTVPSECQTKNYLCTNQLDLSSTTSPELTAMINYQAASTDGDGDAGTDDELLQILVGQGDETPPSEFAIPGYATTLADTEGNILLGNRIPDNDTTDETPGIPATTFVVDLHSFVNPDPGLVLNGNDGTPLTIQDRDDSAVFVCFEYAGVFSWYAQIDNVAVRAANCSVGDADRDRLSDAEDNCTNVVNPDQLDGDGDDFGNLCDGDYNNDCSANISDLAILRSSFLSSDGDAEYRLDVDHNGDGVINLSDLAIFRSLFLQDPGPSFATCALPRTKEQRKNRRTASR